MKRILSILILAVMLVTAVGGCAKESKRPFDYDLSKYIELGQFTGIEYKYEVAPVDDAAIDAYIESKMAEKGYGEKKEITNRAIRSGDVVNIDFAGTIDGVAFEGGSAKNFDLTIGSKTLIDGFEDGLIGLKKGEKKDLNLKFPENYGKDDLKGKDVVFAVTVNKITGTVYPELTDTIAAELSDKKTKAEYLELVKEELAKSNEQAAVDAKESEIWKKIVENVKVKSLPEKEIEKYKKLLIESYDSISQQQYGITYEEYLKQATGKGFDDPEIADNLKIQAESAVKEYMTIVAIARDQDLDISDTEYYEAVDKYAKQNGYSSSKQFLEAVDEGQFYLSLLIGKVMDFVVENAVEVK